MTDFPELEHPVATTRLRSGAAAKLAGLPVTTLRVWERRYGVVAAPKTATGQRLYSTEDVQRLRLLKQLTDRGHAIGTVAGLPLPALRSLADGLPSAAASGDGVVGEGRAIVVGRCAAEALGGVPGYRVLASHDALAQAELQIDDGGSADLLLVHLSSLQPAAVDRLLRLAARWGVQRLAVLYTFGADALAQSLRGTGAVVRRDPTTAADLARLLAPPVRQKASWLGDAMAAPSRYDDRALEELSRRDPSLACECTRHVAEIVLQLARFERYSAECAVSSPSDLALHRHLTGLTGVARTLLEYGLQRLLAQNAPGGAQATPFEA